MHLLLCLFLSYPISAYKVQYVLTFLTFHAFRQNHASTDTLLKYSLCVNI